MKAEFMDTDACRLQAALTTESEPPMDTCDAVIVWLGLSTLAGLLAAIVLGVL